VDGKASLKGAWLSHVNHLNFGEHNHIPGTADRLRRCQLSLPVSVINYWQSAAMLITSTVKICIQHLGRVEEMVFAAWCSYASAVLRVVILSIRPSVHHTHALWLIQRTYWRYFYTTWKVVLLVKCDFSYSCAAADNISTDLRRCTVPLRYLSYLFKHFYCTLQVHVYTIVILSICHTVMSLRNGWTVNI